VYVHARKCDSQGAEQCESIHVAYKCGDDDAREIAHSVNALTVKNENVLHGQFRSRRVAKVVVLLPRRRNDCRRVTFRVLGHLGTQRRVVNRARHGVIGVRELADEGARRLTHRLQRRFNAVDDVH
jgi:hypothetical protein